MYSLGADKRRSRLRLLAMASACFVALVVPALAGSYRDSAHGSASYGANRSAIDSKYIDFTTGNCAHCHEMHASVDGVEPSPAGGAVAHALFAVPFDITSTQNLYVGSDNFCFTCHSDEAGPMVDNQDYSGTFGGAAVGSGPQSIFAAFNQTSYHNLYDIWSLMQNPAYGWFGKTGNPCSACHNSHLAKRNWDSAQAGFPLASAISKPGSHNSLWGEAELMWSYFSYEAPYSFGTSREPGGIGQADGGNTPDYVGFCTSCHTPDATIWSTTLGRELKKIDWGTTVGLLSNKHGAIAREGASTFREPYATASALKSNFVLSCLDCHEAHGSENVMLLRRRVNGEDMEGPVVSTDAMSSLCKRCHQDDLAAAAGTGQADRWEYVHHDVAGAPYAQSGCTNCHASGDGSTPIACGNCHGHGKDDSLAGASATGRKTF